ncbi:response regulator [Bifidobacterium sp. SMA15]|uniref:DNA-binding response regulator MtrA n=2 Tax=Bifidobacterium platyrrhinorum TaxID=2661628 RepID=A0A6L9SQ98_9BIFI|nr:response regulator [Bifidobacterium platyrrhinorum]
MILIVDDDQALGEMLSIVLENEGFRTTTCTDGLRAVEVFPTVAPDLVLLDVMLPGIDGTEVARRIRESSSNVPIIMLTAKSDTVDVVAGLEAGADDYVPKPFKVAELLARIRARFRIRAKLAEAASEGAGGAGEADPQRIERGSVVIDRPGHTATKDGVELNLTPMEFELLAVLAAGSGEAISRSTLLRKVWGYEGNGDTRLVNVHIQRLRAKVEDDPERPRIIVTVRGIGYKFVPPPPEPAARP